MDGSKGYGACVDDAPSQPQQEAEGFPELKHNRPAEETLSGGFCVLGVTFYLFLSVLGLLHFAGAFSSCGKWGLLTVCCGVQAAHFRGFLCEAWALGLRLQ